jgi:hypothetical protein
VTRAEVGPAPALGLQRGLLALAEEHRGRALGVEQRLDAALGARGGALLGAEARLGEAFAQGPAVPAHTSEATPRAGAAQA